jgi:acyl-coenzyme A synthetase/AMP-(fatty) acid ligase
MEFEFCNWLILNAIQGIIDFCKEHMASYKNPRIVMEFIDALPKSSVGKVIRRELRMLEQEKLA